MAEKNPFQEAFEKAATDLGHDPKEVSGMDLLLGGDDDDQSDEDQDDVDTDDEVDESEEDESDDEKADEDTEDEADADGDEEADEGQASSETRYFKIDLTGVPDEVRQQVLGELQAKDRLITRQGQEKSELETRVEELTALVTEALTPEADETASVELPSDEELIQRITTEYDLDPEDPFYEVHIKAALPGFKAALASDARSQAMSEQIEMMQFERDYTSGLRKLEKVHGNLPIEDADFINWAANNGFGDDPAPAYMAFMARAERVTAPPKPKDDAARKEAKRAAKKAAATGARKPSGKTKPADAKVTSFDDAIALSLEQMKVRSEEQ